MLNHPGDSSGQNEIRRSRIQALPFRAVRASHGKIIRAEPAAALYEKGRVHHVGAFPELEEEMTGFAPLTATKSPDRMDALVWALAELTKGGQRFILA